MHRYVEIYISMFMGENAGGNRLIKPHCTMVSDYSYSLEIVSR